MKKNQTMNKKSGDIEVKTNIFSVPNEIWGQNFDQFVFNSGKTMPFIEFAENKDNFEFMKEFNLQNENKGEISIRNSDTGDKLQIHKGFLQ